jgi:hypothetical protein
MIDHLLGDMQALRKADVLIGKIWLTVLVRRAGLFAFAGLIGVFGLGMANIAGYNALQQSIGAVWAASVMAMVDFAIAAIVLAVAAKSSPGPEVDAALHLRKMALESIQEDARGLKATLKSLGDEMRSTKETIAKLTHNPLDVVTQNVLVPAVLIILSGLHSKKDQAQDRRPVNDAQSGYLN